jgi:hypothetical protein
MKSTSRRPTAVISHRNNPGGVLIVDVFCINRRRLAQTASEPNRVVSFARANVGDSYTLADSQPVQYSFGLAVAVTELLARVRRRDDIGHRPIGHREAVCVHSACGIETHRCSKAAGEDRHSEKAYALDQHLPRIIPAH